MTEEHPSVSATMDVDMPDKQPSISAAMEEDSLELPQLISAQAVPSDEDFAGIECCHYKMSMEQEEHIQNAAVIADILKGLETNKTLITGLGKCPKSMDKAMYDRWISEKREDAPRDAFHAYLRDHGFESNLRKMMANTNLETGMMTVTYSRSAKILQESSKPLGRMFAAGMQRVRRELRGLIYGPGIEIDICNCMPAALCDLCLDLFYEGQVERMTVEHGFETIYRLGRGGEREDIMQEVENVLQHQVSALQASDNGFERLRAYKDRNEIIMECNKYEQEKDHGATGPFQITKDYVKRFILSVFLRKEKPRVYTKITEKLWDESNRLYDKLWEYAEHHRDHWTYDIREHVTSYLNRAEQHTTKNRSTPKDPETGLPMPRWNKARSDPGFVEYENPKGSFLSLVFQEIEHRQIMCAATFLGEVVRRHNKLTGDELHDEFPIIFDGIMSIGALRMRSTQHRVPRCLRSPFVSQIIFWGAWRDSWRITWDEAFVRRSKRSHCPRCRMTTPSCV